MTPATARSRLVQVVRAIAPPLLVGIAKRLVRRRSVSDWEYRPAGWDDRATLRGWDEPTVARTQADRWPALAAALQASGSFSLNPESRDPSELDLGMHNTLVSFAYVAARAAQRIDRLRILDWGGGIGQYSLLARAALPATPIDYHVVDLPSYCAVGREVATDVTFHESDDASWSQEPYDLVVASSSLQYVRDWRATLAQLVAVTHGLLYVTRLPLVERVPSFVVVQRPYRHGYATEYQGWFLNRDEVVAAAEAAGATLERRFLIDERPDVPGAPEAATYGGFLFRANAPRRRT